MTKFIMTVTPIKLHITLLVLATSLVIQSCGFQLRGTVEISQDVSPLYLQQNSVFDLARELKLLLAANKVSVTDNFSEARSRLTLLNESKRSRVLSVDGDGRAREYLLTYTVNFSFKFGQEMNADTKEITETLSVSRTLLFDTNAVLAVSNESELLYQDMRRDVARLILLKLQARSIDRSSAENYSVDGSAAKNSSAGKIDTQKGLDAQ